MNPKYQKEIEQLDKLSYEVTQNSQTESPFSNKYDRNFKEGIYIDKVSKKVLFLSTDKFDSGCGWPAFSKPFSDEVINEEVDNSHFMSRIEVRSTDADSHLGHVFNDGPKENGGLRYCINSASLIFIDKKDLIDYGYEEFIKYFSN